MAVSADKVKGMIAGVAIGDTLGAAHEFSSKNVYTGRVQGYTFHTRWQGSMNFPAGRPTDDTEMTLALLRTLARDGKYSVDSVTTSYLMWANGYPLSGYQKSEKCLKPPMMGINTRERLGTTKTLKGYTTKLNKATTAGESQSNGSLMRASPLALVGNWKEASRLDASITNPNPINQACSEVYSTILRYILVGREEDIVAFLETVIQDNSYPEIVRLTVDFGITSDLKGFLLYTKQTGFSAKTKGWVINALYVAIVSLFTFTDYPTCIREIVTNPSYGGPGSDTDTLAAIAGAILGARIGFTALMENPETKHNWEAVSTWNLSPDTVRPVHPDFTLDNIDAVISKIVP